MDSVDGGLWFMGSGLGSRTKSWGSWSYHTHTARKFVDGLLCFDELLVMAKGHVVELQLSCEQENISFFFGVFHNLH